MARIAILCPPYFSHVRLFEVLGDALASRGHEVHFILNAGALPLVTSPTIAVHAVAGRRGDPGAAQVLRNAERPSGLLGIRRTIHDSARLTDQLCAGAPALLRRLGIEAVIGDQLEPAAFLVAAHLGLPALAVASALPINRAPGLPLPYLNWIFDPSPEGIKRAQGGERVADWLSRKHYAVIEAWAKRWGLPRWRTLQDCLPASQVSQVLKGYDFPREEPTPFTSVGPIRRAEDPDQALPFTRDPAKPLVFASLGTVQGHRWRLFRSIAKAVHAAGGQIGVAHCGKLSPRLAAKVGADWITDFVPQRATLKVADLTVCHAGLNTVLDSIEAGVPVLARPIAFDQQGATARLIHYRLGERMQPRQSALNRQVARMLGDAELRKRVQALGATVPGAGGTARAVDIIEAALVQGSSRLVSP